MVSELPSPKAKFAGKPIISGTRGGHTLNLHQFVRDGVALVGHLRGVHDGKIEFAPDLYENLSAADRFEADFVKRVDAYIARTGMAAPEETLAVLRDGFDQEIKTELDLKAAGVTNVIWATGYGFDFSMIKLPVTDDDGFPIQKRGVSAFPGLFFVGLPWLHTAKSGLIFGVGEDARYIADRIAARSDERIAWRGPAPALQGRPAKKLRTMRAALVAIGAATAIGLSIAASHASDVTSPPAVDHVATPARQLDLGMTAAQVFRIMGEPVKTTAFLSEPSFPFDEPEKGPAVSMSTEPGPPMWHRSSNFPGPGYRRRFRELALTRAVCGRRFRSQLRFDGGRGCPV
jgi:hypothetical protein